MQVHAVTIRTLAHEANAAVAGYLRGQALVCLILGTIYAVGLTIVGLQFGIVIGLIAGLISFIPFVGTLVGAVLSIGMTNPSLSGRGSALRLSGAVPRLVLSS